MHQMRSSAQQSGAAVGFYTLSDFIADVVPPCKAYVFANAFRLTDAQIDAIRARLDREGATAIWAYAAGYLGPDGPDITRSERLTGMALAAAEGVQGSQGVGTVQGAWGRTMRIAPRFTVTDPTATPIGRYRSDNAVSAARIQDGHRTSVFVGDMGVTPGLMQVLFREAGAHIWTQGGESVQTDGQHLIVHSGEARAVDIHLPKGVEAEPILGTKAQRGGGKIVVPFGRGETHWFRLKRQGGK